MPRPPSNLGGKRYGKLKAICIYGTAEVGRTRPTWLCLCDCGNYKIATAGNLTQGQVKSCGCLLKLPEGEACFNRLFASYKRDARNREIDFTLSRDDFRSIVEKSCHYCDVPPKQQGAWHPNNNGRFTFNGVDRVDNNLGYTLENCVAACGMCNRCKSSLSKESFLEWVTEVYKTSIME